MIWVAALARAQDADCPAVVEAFLPAERDDVPPDVAPVLIFGPNGCPDLPAAPILVDGNEPVPFELVEVAPSVIRLVPDEPLIPGEAYDLGWVSDFDAWFTVADGEARAPEQPAVDAAFAVSCEAATTLTVALEGAFPEPDASRGGLVWLVAAVDGVLGPEIGPVVYHGQRAVRFDEAFAGGRELCVSLAFDDLSGEREWTTAPVCSGELVCAPPVREEGGCGCANGGDAGVVGVLAGLVAVGRRRERPPA